MPHHFGLFAFNTLDTAVIDAAAAACDAPLILRPEIGVSLRPQRK